MNGKLINCKTCQIEFYIPKSRIGKKFFCSKICYIEDMKGRKLSPYAYKIAIKTLKSNKEKRLANMRKGNKHILWKGEDAGYRAIHYWVIRQLGPARWCSLCGAIGKMQWANVDHKYRRNILDYFSACSSCHKKYDIRMKKCLKTV